MCMCSKFNHILCNVSETPAKRLCERDGPVKINVKYHKNETLEECFGPVTGKCVILPSLLSFQSFFLFSFLKSATFHLFFPLFFSQTYFCSNFSSSFIPWFHSFFLYFVQLNVLLMPTHR